MGVVAFIRPGDLPLHHRLVFRDDRVMQQADWLSQAVGDNRFRLMHGMQLEWASLPSSRGILPIDFRILRRVNPTRVRPLMGKSFPAPIEAAPNPA